MNTIQDIAVRASFADGFVADFRIGSGTGKAKHKLTAEQIRTAAERQARSHWRVRYAQRSTYDSFALFNYPTPEITDLAISGMVKPKAAKRAKPVCCPQCQHSFAIAA